jgi:acyl carrier protein
MNIEEIRARLSQVFEDVMELDEIDLRDDLTADDVEEWDSLSHVRLIVSVERKFSIRFSNSEIETLKNVGDLIGQIEKKLEAGSLRAAIKQ